MTCRSAPSRPNARASGPRARAATTLGRSAWLVTRDEVADPQNLPMWLKVNGQTMQDGSTRTMVYGVAHLVGYLSQFMTRCIRAM